jgi:3-oxoacyl-(acyl-carrier-protein) synthase
LAPEQACYLFPQFVQSFARHRRNRQDARAAGDRFAQFAMAASISAVADSGIDFQAYLPESSGVLIGSGIGGLSEFETQHSAMMAKGPGKISPFTIPKLMVNAGSGQVSIRWGLRGPISAIATACASATNAIGDSLKLIQVGDAGTPDPAIAATVPGKGKTRMQELIAQAQGQ